MVPKVQSHRLRTKLQRPVGGRADRETGKRADAFLISLSFWIFALLYFKDSGCPRTYCIVQEDLKPPIFLSPIPKFCEYRHGINMYPSNFYFM